MSNGMHAKGTSRIYARQHAAGWPVIRGTDDHPTQKTAVLVQAALMLGDHRHYGSRSRRQTGTAGVIRRLG